MSPVRVRVSAPATLLPPGFNQREADNLLQHYSKLPPQKPSFNLFTLFSQDCAIMLPEKTQQHHRQRQTRRKAGTQSHGSPLEAAGLPKWGEMLSAGCAPVLAIANSCFRLALSWLSSHVSPFCRFFICNSASNCQSTWPWWAVSASWVIPSILSTGRLNKLAQGQNRLVRGMSGNALLGWGDPVSRSDRPTSFPLNS